MMVYELAMPERMFVRISKDSFLASDNQQIAGDLTMYDADNDSDEYNPLFMFVNQLIRKETQALFWKRVILIVNPRRPVLTGHSAGTTQNVTFIRRQLNLVESVQLSASS